MPNPKPPYQLVLARMAELSDRIAAAVDAGDDERQHAILEEAGVLTAILRDMRDAAVWQDGQDVVLAHLHRRAVETAS